MNNIFSDLYYVFIFCISTFNYFVITLFAFDHYRVDFAIFISVYLPIFICLTAFLGYKTMKIIQSFVKTDTYGKIIVITSINILFFLYFIFSFID